MATTPIPRSTTAPVPIQLSSGTRWLVGTLMLSFMAYYFVGMDQGAVSVFGHDTHIHELVHDARHLLGFPCH